MLAKQEQCLHDSIVHTCIWNYMTYHTHIAVRCFFLVTFTAEFPESITTKRESECHNKLSLPVKMILKFTMLLENLAPDLFTFVDVLKKPCFISQHTIGLHLNLNMYDSTICSINIY